MARVIERWGGDPTILRAERILADNGVAIEYVHTPLQSGNNNVLGRNELTGDATRLALVWRDEMYGARIGNEWRHVAASYGVPYIHRELSIFVHLPDDFPVRDGAYRQRLVLVSTGEELEGEDFMKEIHALRPQWVRDLVEKAIAPRQATSMAEVEKTLAERLRKARVKRVEQAYSGTLASLGDGNSEGGASVDEMTTPERHNRTVLDPEADADPAGHKAQQPRQPQRKVKAAQRISSAPRIIWLDQPDAVEAEELTYRAAKYVPGTNELYMNELHPSVASKLSELEQHYSGQVDMELVRPMMLDYVRVAMALHVGTSVVHALAKQGARDWTGEHINLAYSPECLTVVAENSEHLLGAIRQRLGTTDAFKSARAL